MIASQLLLASSFTSNQPTQLQALLRQVYANGREGSVFSTDPEWVGTYQDWTGSTPATDVEQAAGLQLDSRFELVRGAEQIVNGDNEAALMTVVSVQRGTLTRSSSLVFAGSYSAQYTCTDTSVGDHFTRLIAVPAGVSIELNLWFYNPTGNFSYLRAIDTNDGSWYGVLDNTKDLWVNYRAFRSAKSTSWTLGFGSPDGSSFALGINHFIDNVSVKFISGNHAIQAMSGSRPKTSARVNWLYPTRDPAGYLVSSGLVSLSATTDPNSNITATKFSVPASGAIVTRTNIITARSAIVTVSLRVRYDTGATTRSLLLRNGTTATDFDICTVNTQTGIIISGTGWTSTPDLGGYFKYTYTRSTGITVGNVLYLYCGATGGSTPVGDWSVSYPQLESGTAATRYQWADSATVYDTIEFKKYVVFDGIDDHWTSSGGGGSSGIFLCFVGRFSDTSDGVIWQDRSPDSLRGYFAYTLSKRPVLREYGAGGGVSAWSNSNISIGVNCMLTFWDDGSNLNVQLDNGPVVSIARPVVVAGDANVYIGRTSAASPFLRAMDLGELWYVKDSGLTPQLRLRIQQSIAARWGISLS